MSLSKKHFKKIAELIGKHTVQPNKESNNNFVAYGFVWDFAKYFIEENKNFKKALDKYLQIDYFVYQQILNNNQFWYWQLGKVLKYET